MRIKRQTPSPPPPQFFFFFNQNRIIQLSRIHYETETVTPQPQKKGNPAIKVSYYLDSCSQDIFLNAIYFWKGGGRSYSLKDQTASPSAYVTF